MGSAFITILTPEFKMLNLVDYIAFFIYHAFVDIVIPNQKLTSEIHRGQLIPMENPLMLHHKAVKDISLLNMVKQDTIVVEEFVVVTMGI